MIPTIDLAAWRAGDPAVGPTVDDALQRAGFLLAGGHGVDDALRADVRAAARRFFALPTEVKQRYAVRIGGRGSLAPGVEANGNVEGVETPPDLKESFAVGPETPTGDPDVDAVWFPPNVWPAEVPELRAAVGRYVEAMTAVSLDLLELCADALSSPRDALSARHEPHLDLQHQSVPAAHRGGRARAGAVPDRCAHRLRHRHGARSRAGGGRPAGRRRGHRLGRRPVRPGRVHRQHRRPARALDRAALAFRPAPGCSRPSRTRRTRSSSRWCSSSSSTTTRWSRRSRRRWGDGRTSSRWCPHRSCGSDWTRSSADSSERPRARVARGYRRPVSRASPVPAPATRDQADAYRFGLRRLEAALVRGDPVPLHEQIRSQRRAGAGRSRARAVGPVRCRCVRRDLPEAGLDAPGRGRRRRLGCDVCGGAWPGPARPVANLPARPARARRAQDRRQHRRRPGHRRARHGSGLPSRRRPATPAAAVPGALAVRPDGPPVSPSWAVCDTVTPDGALVQTTVIGGAPALATSPAEEGVLLDADGSTWLVSAGRRHRVDADDGGLAAALGITGRASREVAPALLSLLPEGPPLVNPAVPGRGRPAPDGLPGRIGDVLVARPAGGEPQHYVVLAGGVQEVPAVLAEVLGAASGRDPQPVGPADLASATVVDELPVAGWPDVAPRVREAAEAPALCWSWTAGGDPNGGVWTGAAPPLADLAPVALAQADGPGDRLDAVAVGAGGAVRGRARPRSRHRAAVARVRQRRRTRRRRRGHRRGTRGRGRRAGPGGRAARAVHRPHPRPGRRQPGRTSPAPARRHPIA